MTNFTELRDTVKSVIQDNADSAEQWTITTQQTMELLAATAGSAVNFGSLVEDMTYVAPSPLLSTPPTLDIGTEPTLPADITLDAITPYAAPTDPNDVSVSSVSYVAPSAPTAPAVTAPTFSDQPDVSESDVSFAAVEQAVPDSFSGLEIVVPELAALTLPTFTSLVPSDAVDTLVAEYSYTEPAYVAKIEAEVTSVLQSVLGGTLIVGTTIWDALWDRVAGDAGRQQVADEWAASNLAASLGMTGLPSETLLSRLDKAQQDTQARLSQVRLEQAIQEALQRREDFWNAVKDGIAWEGLWINHHDQIAGRALASAAKAHEALVATFNANLQRHNILLARAAEAVNTGRLELDRALTVFQENAQLLDKTRIEVTVEDQKIQRWLGEWQGYKIDKDTRISWYAERVRAYGLKIQEEQARVQTLIQGANLDIQLFDANVRAYGSAVQGATAAVNGAVSSEQLKLSKLASDIQLYQAKVSGERARLDADIAFENSKVQLYSAEVGAFASAWQGIANKANALAQVYQAEIQGYSAKIQNAAQFVDAAYKESQVKIQAAKEQVDLAVGQLQNLAALQAGLAQAYLSASDVNLGANQSYDFQCSTVTSVEGGSTTSTACP